MSNGRSNRRSGPPRILALLASGTEVRALLPVIDELRTRGADFDVVDTGRTGVGNAGEALPPRIARRRLGAASTLSAAKLLSRIAPDLILVANDNLFFNRTVINEAKTRLIPSVLVQEGETLHQATEDVRTHRVALKDVRRSVYYARLRLANRGARELWARLATIVQGRPHTQSGYGFGGADVFCVANERAVAAFRHAGCASRLIATGIPNLVCDVPLDQEPTYDVVLLSTPLARAGICWPGEYTGFLVAAVDRLRSCCSGWRIAVKPHPADSDETFDALRRRHQTVDVLKGWTPERTIAGGRSFLSFGSTMLLDVWYSRRTGICILDEPFYERLRTSMVYARALDHGAALSLLGDGDGDIACKLEDPFESLVAEVRREYYLSVGAAAGQRIADVVYAELGLST